MDGYARDGYAVGTCLLDHDGVIVHLDPAFAALVGHTITGSDCGRHIHELLPDAPALATTQESREALRWRHEGPEGAVEIEARPGSGPIAHVLLARPAAAVDDALARQQLELIFEASPLALVISDSDRRVRLWSRSAERAFGWTREEIVGQTYPLIADADLFDQLWRNLEQGRGLESFEGKRRCKDGSEIDLRIHTAPLYQYRGTPEQQLVGVIALLEDLTETRQLQQRAQLNERMEAVASLAGGLGHEINNLLAVVSNTGELLRLDPRLGGHDNKGSEGSEARLHIAELLRATGLARELVAQLMTFGRRQVVRPEIVDLNQRLQANAKVLRHVLGERIHLQLDLDDEALPIRVDTKQLDQVLLNLAVNAADAMAEGGRLTLSTSRRELGDDKQQSAHHACLVVRDTGTGIPAEILPRIFDPFFTTKQLGAGTGLGLAHVYSVVSQSNGQVEVESQEGVGTSFYLFFPLIELPAPAPAPRREASPAGRPGSNERILLVEDDEGVRRSTSRLLMALGYRVEAASDGLEALEILADHADFDLVVTDVAMPRLNGPGLASRMQELYPSLPVLFMSGNVDAVELRDQVARGDVSFLQKPASLRELAQATRAVLDAV
ncbi:MAG: response regulator [Myxococcales bacterium]|nr:response regulator [Myxococcales bacterium]